MEKENFIKDSKMAIKGVINGIIGSFVYEIILALLVLIVVTNVVNSTNTIVDQDQLNVLVGEVYNKYPLDIMVSCVSSIVVLGVFVYVLGFNKIKEIFKKAFNKKTLKWGLAIGVSLISVSIIYNSIIIELFNLETVGNENQNNVINLIGSSSILGFLSVVVLAPIVEELTFRYCMFGGLYTKNKKVAYIVSASIFMFMHAIASLLGAKGLNLAFLQELLYLPPYLISGLLLCYAYDKTDNLGSSIIAHALNNLVSFLSIVLL